MKVTMNFTLAAGLLLAGVVLGSNAAQAASFDCTKASSSVEKMVCGTPALSQLDDELASAFRNAVANSPEVRQEQSAWLRDTRGKCEVVDCLVSVYQARIQALGGNQSVQSPTAPQKTAPASLETNPVAIAVDATTFIGATAQFQENYWSDPKQVVFGKRIADWTDQDFQLLEQKLRDQIVIERNVAVEYNQRVGLKTSPDENSLFQVAKRDLQKAISALPQFKSWANLAREKGQADDARRLAQDRQRQTEEISRQQQETASATRSNAPTPNTSVVQGSASRSAQNDNGLFLQIFFLVLAATLAGWIWNKFFRARCPKCKSTTFNTSIVAEGDPFKSTKQVREKNSRGTNTRHVQTTCVMRTYAYRCMSCQHEWSEKRKEEL